MLDEAPSSIPPLPPGFVLDEEPKGERGFTAFLNQGIASALGGPVDLVNAGLGAIGVPVSEEPFGGSASIARGMGAIGVRPAERGAVPESNLEYVARGIGGASGALFPAAGVVGAATNASSPVIRGAAQTLSRPFTQAPTRALAAEVTAGAGSGLGEAAAEKIAPGNSGAQLAGSLVGGITGGMLPAAINRFGPTRMAVDFAASQLAP